MDAASQIGPYLDGDLSKLRDEIDRIKYARTFGFWKSKTVLSSNIDATMLMEDLSPIQSETSWYDYTPRVNGLSMTQNYQGSLTERLNGSLGYAVATNNGNGTGFVTAGLSQQINEQIRGRLDFAAGTRKHISLGITTALSKKAYYSPIYPSPTLTPLRTADILCVANFHGGSIVPHYQFSLSHIFATNNIASVTVLGSSAHRVAIGLSRMSESNPGSVALQVLTAQPHVSLPTLDLWKLS